MINMDEAPGIAPKDKTQQQGQCRYCKQYRLVWAVPGSTQEELDRIAEEDCNCEEGEPARKQAYNKNTAYAWADKKWPDHGCMYWLMMAAVDAVTEHDVAKISIAEADGITKYDLRLDKEERLIINTRVTRTNKARF